MLLDGCQGLCARIESDDTNEYGQTEALQETDCARVNAAEMGVLHPQETETETRDETTKATAERHFCRTDME